LDFGNRWLQYSQEALLPFFVVHEPVIIVIAYFVVQWDAGLVPKMIVVVFGAFAVSLGFYQFIVRRIGPLRAMFGMKATRKLPALQPCEATPASHPGSLPSA
jgi:hypothetical protein